MKNVDLFQKMRQEAKELDTQLRQELQVAETKKHEAWQTWRASQSDADYEKFCDCCEQVLELRKKIERNEVFLGEQWYMTEYLFSDAHAYEVVEVHNWNRMDVRRLKSTVTPEAQEKLQASFIPGGFYGHTDNGLQEWTFESDETQPILTVRRHKDGKFYRPNTRTCPFVPHTEPYEWYDFNY